MGTPKEKSNVAEKVARGDARQLKDLRGIGRSMLEDFRQLGIENVRQLKTCEAQALYDQMCVLSGQRQDPCVLDTFRCAIEQARDPNLPEEQRDWWYWSRLRLGQPTQRASRARASRTRRSA